MTAVATLGRRPENRKDDSVPFLRKAGVVIALAFELPGAILGGLLIGYLLDKYFNTSPWLMMALTILAFTGVSIRLVQWTKFLSQRRNETDPPGSNNSSH